MCILRASPAAGPRQSCFRALKLVESRSKLRASVSVIVNSRTRRGLSGGGCLGENTQCTNSKRVEPENFPHNGHSACTHSSAQWRARSELILTPPCRRPWRAAPLAQLMRFRDRALPGQPHCADARYSPPDSVRGWKHHRCDFTKCAKAFSVHENIARDCEQRGSFNVHSSKSPA